LWGCKVDFGHKADVGYMKRQNTSKQSRAMMTHSKAHGTMCAAEESISIFGACEFKNLHLVSAIAVLNLTLFLLHLISGVWCESHITYIVSDARHLVYFLI
jgi:hypothetical protein